jgi:hypothetical protein
MTDCHFLFKEMLLRRLRVTAMCCTFRCLYRCVKVQSDLCLILSSVTCPYLKNSMDYFKCVQHAGWSLVTHHTTPSHWDWVTTDYKHTSQSIHSTLGRSAETYPTTLSHRDWDQPVHTYWSTGWNMNP